MLSGHLHLLTHSFQIGEARRKLFKLIKSRNRRKWKFLYTHLVSLVHVVIFCYSPSLCSGLLYYLFYHIKSGNGEYDQVKCYLTSNIFYYMIWTMWLGFAKFLYRQIVSVGSLGAEQDVLEQNSRSRANSKSRKPSGGRSKRMWTFVENYNYDQPGVVLYICCGFPKSWETNQNEWHFFYNHFRNEENYSVSF